MVIKFWRRTLLVVSLSLLFLGATPGALANMASPITEGTMASRPFTARHAQVIREDLFIRLDSAFESVSFEIYYHTLIDTQGTQIPLLFVAADYLNGFTVWLDGEPVSFSPVTDSLAQDDGLVYTSFSDAFGPGSDKWPLTVWENEHSGRSYALTDFLYFETDLDSGEHVFKVTYKASQWIDNSGWVKRYYFRYALSPARYWKSYGLLNVLINGEDCSKSYTTNLGEPILADSSGWQRYRFDGLPVDMLEISYVPTVEPEIQKWVEFGPMNLAILSSIAVALLHLLILFFLRKKLNGLSRFFWIHTLSVLIPFAFCSLYMYYYEFLDQLIGSEAGRHHGYTFFIFILYPVIMPLYLLLIWGSVQLFKYTSPHKILKS